MSAHDITVVLFGKNLTKYENEDFTKILNKGFRYHWFYENDDIYISDDKITITTETKNCEFKKLVSAVKKGLPDVTAVYYYCKPYWTNGITSDNNDIEYDYWSNDKAYLKNKFGDSRCSYWNLSIYSGTLEKMYEEILQKQFTENEQKYYTLAERKLMDENEDWPDDFDENDYEVDNIHQWDLEDLIGDAITEFLDPNIEIKDRKYPYSVNYRKY